MLKIMTTKVNVNIILLLFIEIIENYLVIEESFCSLISAWLFEKKLSNVGSRVKVIINDVINPKVIIHPKSITGFIPLNINERNAHIVVNTVYSIGQNIFVVARNIIFELL